MVSGLFSGPLNKTVEYGCSTEYWLQHCSQKLLDQPSKKNSTEIQKSLGAYDVNFSHNGLTEINLEQLLQIEEDNAPFAEANHHSWTLKGIQESGDVDMAVANGNSLFEHMDTTMAGWSVPASSGPPAAAGYTAVAMAAFGPE